MITTQMKQEEIIETIAFSIGPLLALLFARGGLKSWLKFEVLSAFAIGLALIVSPHCIFKHLVQGETKLSNYHWFLTSLYGTYLIYSVCGVMFLINSPDEAVFSGHLWSKIVANSLLFMENMLSYYNTNRWNYKLLCSSGSFALFNLLISVYFYATTKRPRSSNQFADRVNSIAKIEAFILLNAGLLMFAFPDFSMVGLKNANETHRSLCRTCGILLFSFSFESSSIGDFIYLKDKKMFMLSRLVGSFGELVVILVGHYCLGAYETYPALTFLLTINMVYNLICFYGYSITKVINKPVSVQAETSSSSSQSASTEETSEKTNVEKDKQS